MTRTQKGQFVRTHQVWTPERWDDGYFDNRGRFRIFRPDYPRAYKLGYCLRAHVVWWLAHGEPHPKGTNLHHVNHDRSDDRLENLELIGHADHVRLHQQRLHTFQCRHCGESFTRTGKEVARRKSEGRTPLFCSAACYHAHPKSDESRKKRSESLKRAYAEGRR